jgi:hypothetical protein
MRGGTAVVQRVVAVFGQLSRAPGRVAGTGIPHVSIQVREKGLRELYRMNITYATLFPDLLTRA